MLKEFVKGFPGTSGTSYQELSVNIAQPGYSPIAIAGYDLSNISFIVHRAIINGNYAELGVCGAQAQNINSDFTFRFSVLYVKI